MTKWKKVPGFNYEVSTCGEVRNIKTGRILRPQATGNRDAYLAVRLYKYGIATKYRLHRLVAMAFVNNPSPKTKVEVNHLDGNPHNNHISNLEWCTAEENQAHARGLHIARKRARKAVKYTRQNLRRVLVRKNGARDLHGFFHRFTTGNQPKAIIELKADGSIKTVPASTVVFL